MFKRIIYDDWTSIIPILSFWLTFGVFIAITVRALLLKRSTVDRAAQRPLEDDEQPLSQKKSS
ncbi:MAG: cbb3-type cytochrome oxidase subunit 3 [Lentimonas sp.]|jgi:cbb3-type cytochrome oxidase subunit 3